MIVQDFGIIVTPSQAVCRISRKFEGLSDRGADFCKNYRLLRMIDVFKSPGWIEIHDTIQSRSEPWVGVLSRVLKSKLGSKRTQSFNSLE